VLARERRHGARHQRHAGRRQHGHGDLTAAAGHELAEVAQRVVEVAQDALGDGQQLAPGRRDLDAAGVAVEQARPQGLLGLPDEATQRRLGLAQPRRRLPEAAAGRDLDKGLQLPKVQVDAHVIDPDLLSQK